VQSAPRVDALEFDDRTLARGHPARHAGTVDHFATTHWSLVHAARDRVTPRARGALEELCGTYWPPVYAYVRRRERSPETARDLTQAFFTRLLEQNTLAAADRDRGRFRAFLLTSLRNFLADERDRALAAKRGGGRRRLALDFDDVDSRLSIEPFHELTAERLFEREWALRLLDVVLERLRAEQEAEGRAERFALLEPAITGEDLPLTAIADRLGMTENAARVAAHRLRKRYRAILREEIARTLSDPAEVDDELGRLFEALGTGD
jgi:RNA polymerase sigma factor (sigma-70 family)